MKILPLNLKHLHLTSPPQLIFYAVVAVWWIAGALCIFVPLIKWNAAREAYYGVYGRYIEYEQAQRYYQEAQNQNQNQYQNQNQNGYYYYGFKDCKWYQFKCRREQQQLQKKVQQYQQQYGNGEDRRDQQQVYTPGWYQFLGGKDTEEGRREREEMGMSDKQSGGGVKFVYAWSMVLFISLLIYGTLSFFWYFRLKDFNPVRVLLILTFVTFQYSLLILVLLPQGVIMVDDRDLEEFPYGWYGQLPVLLVYFEYGVCLFSGICSLCLGSFILYERMRNRKESSHPEMETEPDGTTKEGVYGRMI